MGRPVCPACKGKGSTTSIGCPGFKIINSPCMLCKGEGRVTKDQEEFFKAAEGKRRDRIKRGFTLRQEAERLGITPVQLGQIERGYNGDTGSSAGNQTR